MKEDVRKLIESISGKLLERNSITAQVVRLMVELENLEPHKEIEMYCSFVELLEGKFGWSEVKYQNCKKILNMFGYGAYANYGHVILWQLSRLSKEKDREVVWAKIKKYERDKKRIPHKESVCKWTREVLKATGNSIGRTKIVDIKTQLEALQKKYTEVLEENRFLKQELMGKQA